MTCQEALRLLYEVVDKEASQIDAEKVQEHLNNCRDCLARYEFEQMFRTFVVEKASAGAKSEQLKRQILSRIDEQGEEPTGFFDRYKRLVFAAAAVLVIFVAAGLSAAQYYRHKAFVYPFEKSHLENVLTADVGDLPEIKNYLADNMHLSLNEAIPEYKLIRAAYEEVLGKRFVRLHFLNGKSKVSVFVSNPPDIELPGFDKANFSGQEYFSHICGQCQVIYWRKGNSIIIAVSDDKALELPKVISILGPI